MTRERLEDELQLIENRRYYLAMIDRWTDEDFKLDNLLYKKELELQQAIKKASPQPPRKD